MTATGVDAYRWLVESVEREMRRLGASAVHEVDFSVFDKATNRVLCRRCDRFIDATGWAKPCVGGR